MTVYVNKPSLSIREELNRLKKPSGILGEQILRSRNIGDFYDAVGLNRNRIINGNFIISQRNGTSSTTPSSGSYPIDRWVMDLLNADYDVQQMTDAPPGFRNSVKITTANSRSRTSYHFFNHAIEGFNVADLAWGTKHAVNATLSFWVKTSIAGRYSVSITNAGNVYSFPTTFTVNHSNTWEYKTITIPGPQGGTWSTDSGTGVRIKFNLNAGTSFDATANQWTAADKHTVAGTIRIGELTGATMQLSGVQFEKGNVATPFEHRSIAQELALCQRYFYSTLKDGLGNAKTRKPEWIGMGTGNYIIHGYSRFPVSMRATPSVSLFAYILDSGGSDVGDGRNGIMYYQYSGATGYYTHTYGYGVAANLDAICGVNSGENSIGHDSTPATTYSCAYTASAEIS